MLFLFFGFGTRLELRAMGAERTCPRCHNTARWQHLERYRYVSLFFVRLLRWNREQLAACPICGYSEAGAPAVPSPRPSSPRSDAPGVAAVSS
jgi:hypothetical protein